VRNQLAGDEVRTMAPWQRLPSCIRASASTRSVLDALGDRPVTDGVEHRVPRTVGNERSAPLLGAAEVARRDEPLRGGGLLDGGGARR